MRHPPQGPPASVEARPDWNDPNRPAAGVRAAVAEDPDLLAAYLVATREYAESRGRRSSWVAPSDN